MMAYRGVITTLLWLSIVQFAVIVWGDESEDTLCVKRAKWDFAERIGVSLERRQWEWFNGNDKLDADTTLTSNQKHVIGPCRNNRRSKRAITDFSSEHGVLKWNSIENIPTIPYSISTGIRADQDIVTAIESAITEWHKKTCLRFKPVTDRSSNYIEFKNGTGCLSFTGKAEIIPQEISLKKSCATFGELVHLLGKVAGFWHTHSRPDRDEHVTIKQENIERGFVGDFAIFSKDWGLINLDYPYDFTSIQHYPANVFSNSPSTNVYTMVPTEAYELYLNTIGQRVELSYLDAKTINIEYCTGFCSVDHNCQNGGYPHPNSCGQCVCPEGFGGATCTDIAPSVQDSCGGVLTATSQEGVISSPNLNSQPPGKYKEGQQCAWHIKADPGKHILLWFEYLSIPCEGGLVAYHSVSIAYITENITFPGPRFCGTTPPSKLNKNNKLQTTGNMAVVTFKAEHPGYDANLRNGFRLKYRLLEADACSGVICQNGGACANGRCICTSGFTGDYCERAIPCATVVCYNGGSCTDGQCACRSGYTGTNCLQAIPSNPCATVVCYNGGSCAEGQCNCRSGYTGTNCLQVIPTNPCDGVFCANDGTCSGGRCLCRPGYTGSRCQDVIQTDPCSGVFCYNGGSCSEGGCYCRPGFTGANCQDVADPCAGVTCQNGGTCRAGECSCLEGYTGSKCEQKRPDSSNLQCASNPCQNHGVCVEIPGDYRCNCPNPLTGKNCETGIGCGGCGLTASNVVQRACLVETGETTLCYRTQSRRSRHWWGTRTVYARISSICQETTPYCCPNAKLLSDGYCAVSGWGEWSQCKASSCGGCNKATRYKYDWTTGYGRCVRRETQTRTCSFSQCTTCSNDRSYHRRKRHGWWSRGQSECQVPCCEGYQVVGNLCCKQGDNVDANGNVCGQAEPSSTTRPTFIDP